MQSLISDEVDDHRKNHQIGIQQQQDSGVVQTPFAMQAADSLGHAPGSKEEGYDLPMRSVQVFNAGEAGKSQACDERAHREHDGAYQ